MTADIDQIERVPALEGVRGQVSGRAMLVLRTNPVPSSALCGVTSPARRGTNIDQEHWYEAAAGLVQSSRLNHRLLVTNKAESGHDINVTSTRPPRLGPRRRLVSGT